MTVIISSRKQIKKRAREILFSEYRIFLFATLFFTAISLGCTILSKSFCELLCMNASDEVFTMVSLTFDLIGLVIFFPFAAGYVFICTNISSGRAAELSDLFRFYSFGKRMTSCYSFLLRMIPGAVLKLVLPFVILSAVRGYLTEYTGAASEYIASLYFVMQIIVMITVFYFAGGIIISVIDFCGGKAKKHKVSEKRRFFAMRLSLIPLYIISLLTFGVLFIAYTVPFTLIVYSLLLQGENNATSPRGTTENCGDTKIFDIPHIEGNDLQAENQENN